MTAWLQELGHPARRSRARPPRTAPLDDYLHPEMSRCQRTSSDGVHFDGEPFGHPTFVHAAREAGDTEPRSEGQSDGA